MTWTSCLPLRMPAAGRLPLLPCFSSSVLSPAVISWPEASTELPFAPSSSGAIAPWSEPAWLKPAPTPPNGRPMLSKLLAWLRGEQPPKPRVDELALQVTRRQRAVAERLSAVTGRSPAELMDYRRADKLLHRR